MADARVCPVMFYFCHYMLTEDEKKFIVYWENNRTARKKTLKQLAIGLPLAVVVVVAIFVNFFFRLVQTGRHGFAVAILPDRSTGSGGPADRDLYSPIFRKAPVGDE